LINLDTHILIYALMDELKPAERKMLAQHAWGISAIVLWELAKLSQLGKINLSLQDASMRRALRSIHTWPLTWEVAARSTQLDFRGDPADELIAATSLVYDVPLMTRDKAIRRTRLVPLV